MKCKKDMKMKKTIIKAMMVVAIMTLAACVATFIKTGV